MSDEIKCERCKQPTCEPARVPGSRVPCMTCGQPYGNHCYSRHCETQFCFDQEKRAKLCAENRVGTSKGFWEEGYVPEDDSMAVAMAATGKPEPAPVKS